jgi:hypothetical protein
VATGTGLALGYYLLGIHIMHHSSRPVKYFASIHMTDNHVPSLAARCHRGLRSMRKMKSTMLVSATAILLILLNEISKS